VATTGLLCLAQPSLSEEAAPRRTKGTPPPGRSPAAALETGLAAQGYLGIPIQRTASGHFQVDATVNGEQVKFVIDTGAPTLVLDRGVAARLNLPVIRHGQNATGIGDAVVPTDVVSVKKIRFAPEQGGKSIEWSDVQAVAMDLTVIRGGEDRTLNGILGADVLVAAGAIIDLASFRLYLPKH